MKNAEIRLLTDRDARPTGACGWRPWNANRNHFGESADEHRQTTMESATERLGAKPDENFVFGAFHEGQLVGWRGSFVIKSPRRGTKAGLGRLCAPEFPRAGYWRALLVALLEKIKACPDVKQVSLTVVSGQEAASALYRSLGFQTYGIEPLGLKVGDHYFDNDHMVLRVTHHDLKPI